MSDKTAWVLIAAVFLYVIYGLFFTARADQKQLYIYVQLCKDGQCIDQNLSVEPGVNEVMCIYGAMMTVTSWQIKNYPKWKVKSYKCTYFPQYGL